MPAVLAACLAAACSPGPGLPEAPAGPALIAPPPPGAFTRAAAAQEQVIGAYDGMWRAYAAATRTGGHQPRPLAHYAAGQALAVLTRALHANRQHGIVLRGAPSLNPQVTAMSPAGDPDSARVADCADDSRWRQYTTSGAPAPGDPPGRHRIRARLQQSGTAWKVTYLAVEAAGTC